MLICTFNDLELPVANRSIDLLASSLFEARRVLYSFSSSKKDFGVVYT